MYKVNTAFIFLAILFGTIAQGMEIPQNNNLFSKLKKLVSRQRSNQQSTHCSQCLAECPADFLNKFNSCQKVNKHIFCRACTTKLINKTESTACPLCPTNDTKKVKEHDTECSICLETLPQNWPYKIDLCGIKPDAHSFCTKCIMQISLTEAQSACPLCRRSITKEKKEFIIASNTFAQFKDIDTTAARSALRNIAGIFFDVTSENTNLLEKLAYARNQNEYCKAEMQKLKTEIENKKEQVEGLNKLLKAEIKQSAKYRRQIKILGGAVAIVGTYAIYKYRNS